VERPAFRFGRHARNRLRWYRGTWREISEDEVIDIVTRAAVVVPTVKGRSNAWQRLRGNWYRVSYIHEPQRSSTFIVTVTLMEHRPTEEDI